MMSSSPMPAGSTYAHVTSFDVVSVMRTIARFRLIAWPISSATYFDRRAPAVSTSSSRWLRPTRLFSERLNELPGSKSVRSKHTRSPRRSSACDNLPA
jgi:hypothetical protein